MEIPTLTVFIASSIHHIPWVSVPGKTSFACMYSWLHLRHLWISGVDPFHTWRDHLSSRSFGHLYKMNLLFEPAFTYTFTMVQPLLLSSRTFKLKVKIKMTFIQYHGRFVSGFIETLNTSMFSNNHNLNGIQSLLNIDLKLKASLPFLPWIVGGYCST